MSLHPLHDAQGRLYPEADWRWVGAGVMAQYLQCCAATLWQRTVAGAYRTAGGDGVRDGRRTGKSKPRYQYRPGVIFRALRLGRWACLGFDPTLLERAVRLYECDPTATAERVARATTGGTGPSLHYEYALGQLAATVSGLVEILPHPVAPSGPARPALAFPAAWPVGAGT